MKRVAKDENYRYLVVSERERLWELYVTGAGRIIQRRQGEPDSGHPMPYYYTWENGRTLDEFGACYITQGKGEFESEPTGHRAVEAGNVLLLFPGIWHRYRPAADSSWTYYWVHFNGAFAHQFMEKGLISADEPILKTGLNENLLHSYLTLLDRMGSEPPGFQQMLVGNIFEILGIAKAAVRSGPNTDRLGMIVRQATQILEQSLERPLDLRDLASSFHLSYDRFRHIFKQHTGLAPYQYHLELRINRAKELLAVTPLSVKEIAAILQFDDPYHFSRIFKKKTGKSPSKWREE